MRRRSSDEVTQGPVARLVLRRCCAAGALMAITEAAPAHDWSGILVFWQSDTTTASWKRCGGRGLANSRATASAEWRPDDCSGPAFAFSFVQPRFDAPSDAKILNVTQAAFEIAGMLRSRVDATLRYDSVGPADVNRADLELKNSLELVF